MKDAYTNLVLPHQLGKYRLTGRDAAFATELASGTIRRQGTYDAILAACTDRPLANTAAKVLDVLRLGCHQLLGMRVAPHAAISTSVDLVRSEFGPGPTGFANAVLRKVSAHDLDTWLTRLDADRATRYSHPHWVVEALTEAVGEGRDRRAARGRQRCAVGHPRRPARTRDALRAARRADGVLALRRGLGRRRPRGGTGRRRGAGGRAGRGVPARGPRPGLGSDRGPRRPLARPVRRTRRQGGAAGGPGRRARRPGRGQRGAAAPRRPGPPGAGSRLRSTGGGLGGSTGGGRRASRRSRSPTARPRPGTPGPSTGSWSTLPARASVPCGVGPRRAGGGSPRTSTRCSRSSGRSWRARSTWSAPAASSSTRPARRCWPRPATSSGRCWSSATT